MDQARTHWAFGHFRPAAPPNHQNRPRTSDPWSSTGMSGRIGLRSGPKPSERWHAKHLFVRWGGPFRSHRGPDFGRLLAATGTLVPNGLSIAGFWKQLKHVLFHVGPAPRKHPNRSETAAPEPDMQMKSNCPKNSLSFAVKVRRRLGTTQFVWPVRLNSDPFVAPSLGSANPTGLRGRHA